MMGGRLEGGERLVIVGVWGKDVGKKYFENVGRMGRIEEGKFVGERYDFG